MTMLKSLFRAASAGPSAIVAVVLFDLASQAAACLVLPGTLRRRWLPPVKTGHENAILKVLGQPEDLSFCYDVADCLRRARRFCLPYERQAFPLRPPEGKPRHAHLGPQTDIPFPDCSFG